MFRFATVFRIVLISVAISANLLSAQTDASHRALQWLRSQMLFDIDSGPGTAKLVKSYETNSIIGAWVYDQALAIIAFTAAGDHGSARSVLNALRLAQTKDGSWDFAYAYNTGARLDTRIPVGSNAWVVIAIAQYELMTGDESYRDLALANLAWLLQFRDADPNADTYGAFVMGPDHESTTWDESTVYSTEHNVDVYAALRLLFALTGQQRFSDHADEIYSYLVTQIWNPSPDSNDPVGSLPAIFWVGFVDYTKYLDPQSWTVAAIGATGPSGEDFTAALDWAYQELRVSEASVNGISGIQGFDVNASFDLPVDKVWSEGSEGMVTAYFSTGGPEDSTRAVFFHNQTKRYQSANGGVPYATDNSDGWVSFNSVAGTAWFVFNELRINPFQVNSDFATGVRQPSPGRRGSAQPDAFKLKSIYPNPFHSDSGGEVSIAYRLSEESDVTLSVFNLLGQRISILNRSRRSPGLHKTTWNGRGKNDIALPSGVYLITLESRQSRDLRKVVLFR